MLVNSLKTKFDEYLKKYGVDVLVNDADTVRVFLKEYEDKTTTKEHKYLFAPVSTIKQGDYIKINNVYYFVIHEDECITNVYTKFTIRRIKHHINFIINEVLYSIPCLVDEINNITLNESQITTIENKICLTLQENELTSQIKAEDRFIKMGNAWKIISSMSTEKNIIKLYAEKDLFSDGDDIENEIPEGLPIWTIEIVEKDITEVQINNTVDFSAKVYKDGVEQQEINLIWETSNNSIATVDENGVVTALGLGQVDITVKISDMTNIKDTHTISVVEEQQQTITYELNGADDIQWASTEEYNAVKKVNGTIVSANFTFEVVEDGGNSDYYILNTIDNDTCNIKHNQKGYTTITLRATDTETGEYIEKQIHVLSLF